jgi:short subunit dehydrogenase-like uncharacterized protein
MKDASKAICVYAAGGRLGRLVVDELIARGAGVRLGGRDPHKLRALAASLPGNSEWKAAHSDDVPALCEWIRGAGVVVNAGPSSRIGHSLIKAALQERVHYIDGAGEQSHIRRVFDECGRDAEAQGIALVPACGFDYALGDCLARILGRGEGRVREITVAYAISGSDVSANSLQFASETPGGGEVLFQGGRWKPARPEIFQRTILFPAPFGSQLMARYASGEVVTVPRHTNTDRVTALITVASLVPNPRLIPLFPYIRPAVALVRRTPARRLLTLATKLRPQAPAEAVAPTPPRFAIVVEVAGFDGTMRRGVVEGGDFHRVTAATLALAAFRLASTTLSKCGALSPAMVIPPEMLLDNLRTTGVSWLIEGSDTKQPTT